MSRAERLLQLMQVLRQHRNPVSAARLSTETGVSLRTIYRDIAALQRQGAEISGEAGLGYVLRPGFTLPPLMFTAEELEALVLGSQWVAERTDAGLAAAARNALAKITAVSPQSLHPQTRSPALIIGPGPEDSAQDQLLTQIRQALRDERKLDIHYTDKNDQASARILWPIALGFFEQIRVLVAWCELRQDFRHFRLDRIGQLAILPDRYPRRRPALLKDWQNSEGIVVT